MHQQYNDQLGVYVHEKAEQIDRMQSNLAAALAAEKTRIQALQQSPAAWNAGNKVVPELLLQR